MLINKKCTIVAKTRVGILQQAETFLGSLFL